MKSDIKSTAPKSPLRNKISIFRAEEATNLTEEMMPRHGMTEADIVGRSKANELNLNSGHFVRMLFSDESSGVSLVYAWFKANYMLIRHSHNSDCLYYVVSGELTFGTETLGAGDGFMVPAEAKYSYRAGPNGVEVLEFRTATKFNMGMGNTERSWANIIDVIMSNRETWASARPPVAAEKMGAGTVGNVSSGRPQTG